MVFFLESHNFKNAEDAKNIIIYTSLKLELQTWKRIPVIL